MAQCLYCNKELYEQVGYYRCQHKMSFVLYDNIGMISIRIRNYLLLADLNGNSELYSVDCYNFYKLICILPDWFFINDFNIIENKIKNYELFF
jgi:hypothetical protein